MQCGVYQRRWKKDSKCHSIGPPTNGQQSTDSSRVCEQKKDIKKQENQSETVTNFILNYAQDVVRASSDKSNFAFADSNRNLKIHIVEPLNWKPIFFFKDTLFCIL